MRKAAQKNAVAGVGFDESLTRLEALVEEMERGVTWLEGRGAYTGNSRPVLYCVVSRAEVATLKAIVDKVK